MRSSDRERPSERGCTIGRHTALELAPLLSRKTRLFCWNRCNEGRAKSSVDFLTRSPWTIRSTRERERAVSIPQHSLLGRIITFRRRLRSVIRLVSTPPVWCFQPNPGSCTLSVVNLRTVRRFNRNANLYAAADLRAARCSVLAGDERGGGRGFGCFCFPVHVAAILGLFGRRWN